MTGGFKRILVVEDTAVTRFSVRHTLQEHGYQVEEAASGEEALTTAAASPEPFDLVVLDILLPGMDGLAVLQELKSRPKSRYTPVMVLTASASPPVVKQALNLGAVEYLIKPFTPQELLRRVEKLIGPGCSTPSGPQGSLLGVLRLEINRASRAKGVFSLLVARRLGWGNRTTSDLEAHLRRRLRDIDSVVALDVGHLGVVLPLTPAGGAEVVRNKLEKWLGDLEPEAKWQFGLAVYPDHGSDPAALLASAQAHLNAQE
ncbi:MAG: response regulator transcription factor [Clostridia bacterium]|nr:response regulator transcription factor [Clostridia bacterium]MDH7573568.1 response regulator transcription factor [Clostridia bacterium]